MINDTESAYIAGMVDGEEGAYWTIFRALNSRGTGSTETKGSVSKLFASTPELLLLEG